MVVLSFVCALILSVLASALEEPKEVAKDLDRSKTIILCCASGTRSAAAMGILKKHGFENLLNAGPWTNTLT